MRNMAFSLTTTQVRNRTKDVTRRRGWKNLKPGERVCAIVKGMGLKKGQKVERLCIIECVSNTAEWAAELIVEHEPKYSAIRARSEVDREGFPNHSVEWFVRMLMKHNHMAATDTVHRIEFTYVD